MQHFPIFLAVAGRRIVVSGGGEAALAALLPTLKNDSVVLDLGANTECDTENLVQFAIMGQIFARAVLGLDRPVVGLLNVGSEEQKGHEAIREAATILREIKTMPFDFHGFVEGDDE